MDNEYFKILAPFTKIEDLRTLKKSGADELYCGYVTTELTRQWPLAFSVLNRRGTGQSFENRAEFTKAIDEANRLNLPVYVTVNGSYTPDQYHSLLKLTKEIEALNGVKGIIIADIGFLLTLKQHHFKKEISVSTAGTCFNSMAVDFYKEMGADRVILDRQLTSSEIKSIIKSKKTDIGVEIFIIRESCGGFIDGFCGFLHCSGGYGKDPVKASKNVLLRSSYNTEIEPSGCSFYFKEIAEENFEICNLTNLKNIPKKLGYEANKSNSFGCRICELYDLKDYLIRSLKIIGRGYDIETIAKLVRLLKEILVSLKKSNTSRSDFNKKCKALFYQVVNDSQGSCTEFDCYFSKRWKKHEK